MYLTLNSEFRPFTYDELVKPLSDYTEAYNKVEEQYSTLAQQTEAWKNIATQENSPEAYAMYKRYSDELNAVIDDFSRGMTAQNRSKLTGLKSRYSSEITPISLAYDAMSKANAYRDTVKGQDDSAIFNVDRYNSLDDFLNGQMADNSFISGNNLQATIANQMLMDSYNKYNELISTGHSKRAAANIVSKGNWVKEGEILDNIYSSSGITSEEAASKIKTYADRGIAQGINAFSINTDEVLLNEEIAKARAYSGRGSDRGDSRDPEQTPFNMDDTLLRLYDFVGLDNEYTTENKERITKYKNNSGEYEEYSKTVIPGVKTPYTEKEKLSLARRNTDLVELAWFIKDGMEEEEGIKHYKEFETFKKSNPNVETFAKYMDYVGKYTLYQENGGTKTFNKFVEEELAEEE